jgi:uncharacterized membrane protein
MIPFLTTSFLTPLRIVLMAALAATVIAGFVLVPAGTDLPVHWNILGEVDRLAPREVALLLPLVLVGLLWGIFALVERFATPAQWQAGRHVADAAITGVIGLALVLAVVTLLIGLGQAVNVVQVIALALGVLLLMLGNALPKSRPNGFAGIRIPATLNDPANWRATHRLGGLLCIAGGLVLLVAALVVPPPLLFAWVLGCMLLPLIMATVYSLMRARR